MSYETTDFSFRLRTLFEQLRLDGKSRGGDIRLSLEQQEAIIKEIQKIEESRDYYWEESMGEDI